MTNIHIVHRSIRIHDNTSLIQQIKEQGSVQVIFIFTPEQINVKKNKYFSNNSVQFMIESLKELHEEIKKHGGKFLFFYGDNIKVLSSLHKTDTIKSISYNFEYTPYGTKRSKDIHDFAKKENIIIYEKEDYALYDILPSDTCKKDGTPYLVYTPYMKHLMNDLKVREVDKFNKFEFDSNSKYSKNKYILPFNEINKFYTENKNINVNVYDFIFYIRIDLFLKDYLLKVMDITKNKILFPSICWGKNCIIKNYPRVNDMMMFIPKKYYEFIRDINIYHNCWYKLINTSTIKNDDLDVILNTLHDSDSEKDNNPIYYIVNRPESKVWHSPNQIFDKEKFIQHINLKKMNV